MGVLFEVGGCEIVGEVRGEFQVLLPTFFRHLRSLKTTQWMALGILV